MRETFTYIKNVVFFVIVVGFLVNCAQTDSGEQMNARNPAWKQAGPLSAKIRLRSIPLVLSADQLEKMVKEYGFYERGLHPYKEMRHLYRELRMQGDAVVVDCVHDLLWTSGLLMRASHEKALEVVTTAHYAGFRDWRVPTVEELASLLTPSQYDRYLDGVFSNFLPESVWSADIVADARRESGWIVRFDEGRIQQEPVHEFHGLLLVRDIRKLPVDSKSGASVRGLSKNW